MYCPTSQINLDIFSHFSFQIPYKEDWEAEKQQVYYPVHITPGYEASSDVKKVDVSECKKKKNSLGIFETKPKPIILLLTQTTKNVFQNVEW